MQQPFYIFILINSANAFASDEIENTKRKDRYGEHYEDHLEYRSSDGADLQQRIRIHYGSYRIK